jgi:hypothetical protein
LINCSACCAWLVGFALAFAGGEVIVSRIRFWIAEGEDRRWCGFFWREAEGCRMGSSRRMRRYMERIVGGAGVDIVGFDGGFFQFLRAPEEV